MFGNSIYFLFPKKKIFGNIKKIFVLFLNKKHVWFTEIKKIENIKMCCY